MAVDANDNLLIGGGFRGTIDFGSGPLIGTGSSDDVFVAKLGPGGEALWSLRGGDAFDQFVSAIATTPSGDVVIAGKLLSQLDLGSGPVSDLGGGFAMFLASLSP
ncbi:MAG: hypothetical protein KC731_13070 [Myxococcales bacterium]|nr:hypothetical protein [Myxococcales bacterium]